jgi:hypothetical protein
VTVAGALRYLGFLAQWTGTTQQRPFTHFSNSGDLGSDWILDDGEWLSSSNGHRPTEVWLGADYGWQPFDATPKTLTTSGSDFSGAPTVRNQYFFMSRSVAGSEGDRLPLNVGSELGEEMTGPDPDIGCGDCDTDFCGDQRYTLQAQYDVPRMWSHSHSISVEQACSVDDLSVVGRLRATARTVYESLEGRWDLAPSGHPEHPGGPLRPGAARPGSGADGPRLRAART